MKENLVTVLQSFSISVTSHFYHASGILRGPYQNKLLTEAMMTDAMFICLSMIEFSYEVFRVFMMTLISKTVYLFLATVYVPNYSLDLFIVYLSPLK